MSVSFIAIRTAGSNDKTDTHGKRYRDWSRSGKKIAEFWREIREKKMANSDYNFSSYVFPEFEKYSNEDITHTFIQNDVGEKYIRTDRHKGCEFLGG